MLVDSYRHKGLRKNLIAHLKIKGIKDENVLFAMSKIPRHFFLDPAFDEWAYKDQAFPINENQTISQPLTVAIQSSLLEIKKGDKVLEIGTGSGYQACVLRELGAKVYTIERIEKLFHKTNQLLQVMGYQSIRTYHKDGYQGLQLFAPFDKIIVTAGANQIPVKLKAQLKIGGYLVIPTGKGDIKTMIRLKKISETKFITENFGDFRFVPFKEGVVS